MYLCSLSATLIPFYYALILLRMNVFVHPDMCERSTKVEESWNNGHVKHMS